ncbi:phosphoribosylaminoimidazole synthetase [Paenibacillus sp. M1]|uniref:Phosphoribosylaminoimidazole synthetase n=1 Tax=Paenibacillus haidiansis TaxID=1574488 RepID=A0ABU7VP59_9BACL
MEVQLKNDPKLSDLSYKLGYTSKTKFDFLKHVGYLVFGISIWNSALQYLLIEHEGGLPSWYPAEIFSCFDMSLPYNWYHKFYGYENETGIISVWGYKELVESQDYYIGLQERQAEDINIFLKHITK